MNKKGQKAVFGFALVALVFIFYFGNVALIEPLKESLDDVRDTTALNCPGTLTFNQSDYDDDTTLERLTRRPTCFVTGITMVYFIGTFLLSLVVWLVIQWRRVAR